MEKKIQTIGVLNARSFSVHLDEVRLKNGDSGKRIRIDHPEAAAVLPFITEGEVLMVRQYRYALGKETLEIPAGKLDPGETPLLCAQRELLEETGYRGEMKALCTYAPAIGYSNELIHIFVGRNLKRVEEALIDVREIDAVEAISVRRLDKMIEEGRIQDGKTLLGLFVWKSRHGR